MSSTNQIKTNQIYSDDSLTPKEIINGGEILWLWYAYRIRFRYDRPI